METTQRVSYLNVASEFVGQRIDNHLFRHFKRVPKSRIYRALRKGEVRVNKKRVKPEYKLQEDDNIRIPPLSQPAAVPPHKPSTQLTQRLLQCVLYEDQHLLVLNKPAGIAVHGGTDQPYGLIESMRLARPNDHYLELVHRLDKETSGCLLLAKKRSALRQMHELIRAGQLDKQYLALVHGQWPADVKRVTAPLNKFHLRSGERMVEVSAEGKSAETRFRVKQSFSGATLVEAQLITGRTHQIRVHAAHSGHVIVGDTKYGDPVVNADMKQCGIRRMFLHAHRIKFHLPELDKHIDVMAELDPALEAALQALARKR